MADALGLVTSCFAVAGLAVKVAKMLDDLVGRFENAALSLSSLKSLVATCNASLMTLSLWMEKQYQKSDACTDLTFIQSLAVSTEGCMRVLLALQEELDVIGHISGKLSWTKKATIVWNENRVKSLRDHLSCQNQGLILLLACRHLSQQPNALMQQDNRSVIDDVRRDTTQLREDETSLNEKHIQTSRSRAASTLSAEKIQSRAELNNHLTFLTRASAIESDAVSSDVASNSITTASAQKLRNDYQKNLSKSTEFLVPECPKLRILILGQAGVGKSTLCSMILGISQKKAGVSHRGVGTPAGKVWEEVIGPDNENLILHDSGGFMANSKEEMNQIKKFIKYRREKNDLKDQLHCIWYCVASAGERNVMDVEREFFEEVEIGQIPIFVIFTKYDRLIAENEEESDDETEPRLTRKQRFAKAEEPAFRQFEMTVEKEIMNLAKGKPQIKTCRIAIPLPKKAKAAQYQDEDLKGKEYKLVKFRNDELAGSKDLTQGVGEALDKAGLKSLWIALQRNRADLKLSDSWRGCIDLWWRVQKVSRIPVVPIICMWTLGGVYRTILRRLSQIWGLKTSPEGLFVGDDHLHLGLLEATYDENKDTLIFNSTMLAAYNVGPLAASLTAKITLKMIVGLTLIFERLFLKQQKQGENAEPLTAEVIRAEARKFQVSLERSRMSNEIERSIVLNNCYNEAAAKRAASEAIHLGKSSDGEKYSIINV